MSTNDIPVATIKAQVLTNTPVNGDATLVDDPVALVDSPTALVGGPVTIVENLRVSVTTPKLFPKIPRSS